MKKPILLIDQDDVLAEYISRVVDVFNENYQTTFQTKDCIQWDLVAIFGERIIDVMHEPHIFKTLEPTPYAIETFKRLYESNLFEIYIVTAAHPRTVEAKFEWVREYLPFFPKNHFIVSSVKNMIKGDYLLDDGMHNIEAFTKEGGKGIVFNRPHNDQESIGLYSRVNGWLDFERYIIKECYPELEKQYFERL